MKRGVWTDRERLRRLGVALARLMTECGGTSYLLMRDHVMPLVRRHVPAAELTRKPRKRRKR